MQQTGQPISVKNKNLKAPEIHPIQQLLLPKHNKRVLSNGVPVYMVNAGTQAVIKIEFIFLAGKAYEAHHTVAKCTASLLSEGTQNFTSEEIAEHFDYYGAVVTTRSGVDTARIRLYCMTKHLHHVLPMVKEIIDQPIFPEEEITTHLDHRKERLEIELTKNETIGYRTLTESIFGLQHPYGYNTQIEDLNHIDRQKIVAHHDEHFRSDRLMICMSGLINEESIELVEKYFGKNGRNGTFKQVKFTPNPTDQKIIHLPGPQHHQVAIRIGRPLFDRSHKDFPGMYVANALLGGYFGSRLMTNLREDKGMTYGIYSSVDTFRQGGCFYVSTEVARKNYEASLEEIYSEIEKLGNEPVTALELEMVRNYLMGHLMMQLDGPFNAMDVIKSLLLETNHTESFDLLVDKIQQITPSEIQELISRYLKRDELIEIVVGI